MSGSNQSHDAWRRTGGETGRLGWAEPFTRDRAGGFGTPSSDFPHVPMEDNMRQLRMHGGGDDHSYMSRPAQRPLGRPHSRPHSRRLDVPSPAVRTMAERDRLPALVPPLSTQGARGALRPEPAATLSPSGYSIGSPQSAGITTERDQEPLPSISSRKTSAPGSASSGGRRRPKPLELAPASLNRSVSYPAGGVYIRSSSGQSSRTASRIISSRDSSPHSAQTQKMTPLKEVKAGRRQPARARAPKKEDRIRAPDHVGPTMCRAGWSGYDSDDHTEISEVTLDPELLQGTAAEEWGGAVAECRAAAPSRAAPALPQARGAAAREKSSLLRYWGLSRGANGDAAGVGGGGGRNRDRDARMESGGGDYVSSPSPSFEYREYR